MSIENLGLSNEEPVKPLSLDEAQDLANMVRAKVGVNPSNTGEKKLFYRDENGNYKTREGKEIYAYEYHKAIEEIEELEKLAEEQTKGKEVMHRVGEILQEGGQILSLALASVGIALMADPKQLTQLRESFEKAREKNKFFDAKKKLKELMEAGEDFGEKEGIDTKSSLL